MQTPESQPLPDPAEQPAAAFDAPGTPTQEDAVQSAVAATRADALAIAELCQLAGHPERTAAFLAEGASEAQVRRALLAARAESPEITSLIRPDAQAPESHPDQNPLMKAVKKLTGKE